jgi:hypothetical protein
MEMTTSALVNYPYLSVFTVYILQEPRNRTTEKICKISFDIPLLIPQTIPGDEDQTLYGAKNVSFMWPGVFQTTQNFLDFPPGARHFRHGGM